MIKKLWYVWLMIIFIFMPLPGLAWHSMGHCLVATIAYDNLNTKAKAEVDKMLKALPPAPGQANDFCAAANWPDTIRGQQIDAFTTWHYIDQPLFLTGKAYRHKVYPPNVVWAINQSMAVLMSPQAQTYQKAWFFRFLVHFVGDIHQPLHTTALFNRQFKHGDRGGTRYVIQSPIAADLHTLWDQGVGLVPDDMTETQMQVLAQQLQRKYPPSYFGALIEQDNPAVWADEGYLISKNEVYQVPYGGKPTQAYIAQGQVTSAQRLTLAGYRLAYILNHWVYTK